MADYIKYSDEQIQNLGKRLRSLRKAAGYSGSEKFAYKHDINRAQFAKYETGADMRVSTLMKIIKALDTTPADFFSEGFEMEEETEK